MIASESILSQTKLSRFLFAFNDDGRRILDNNKFFFFHRRINAVWERRRLRHNLLTSFFVYCCSDVACPDPLD